MMFLKRLFKKKTVSLPEVAKIASEEEFDNINNFLADIDKKVATDSRSTVFFKEASNILSDQPLLEESQEILEMQSFISEGDQIEEKKIVTDNKFVKEKS